MLLVLHRACALIYARRLDRFRSWYPYILDPHRHERISESLRDEIGEMIGYELSDPRIGSATVTEVLISPDSKHACVRIAAIGTPAEQQDTVEGLNHAKQFLRNELTIRLQLFKTPELHFELALPAKLAARVPQILKRIRRGRPKS